MYVQCDIVVHSNNVHASLAIIRAWYHFTPLLWQFNVAGNNKMYLLIHVKWLKFLPDFNQIWIFYTYFIEIPDIKFHGNSSCVSRSDAHAQMDRWSQQML